MNESRIQSLLRTVRSSLGRSQDCPVSDAQLLDRYLNARDDTAFEVLVWRHSPLVLGVCHRLLRKEADVEDAFQATFLVLFLKAASIRDRKNLAGWLYRVAYRIALQAKTSSARRQTQPLAIDETATSAPQQDSPWEEMKLHLDKEINRLPKKYRSAVMLCYFAGKTHEEAAELLGCAKNTISVRLMRARELLRRQFAKYGVVTTSAVLGAVLESEGALAGASNALIRSTLSAGSEFVKGTSAAGVRPVILAKGEMKKMFITKCTRVTLFVGLMIVAIALTVAATNAFSTSKKSTKTKSKAPTHRAEVRTGRPAKKKKSPTPQTIALKLVHGVFVKRDINEFLPFVDENGVRKLGGKGSLKKSMRNLPPPQAQLRAVVFFTKEEIPQMKKQYGKNANKMWQRLQKKMDGGFGCLMVVGVPREEQNIMVSLVIKAVNGQNRIVYMDDN